jgi:hypothetical protein
MQFVDEIQCSERFFFQIENKKAAVLAAFCD